MFDEDWICPYCSTENAAGNILCAGCGLEYDEAAQL